MKNNQQKTRLKNKATGQSKAIVQNGQESVEDFEENFELEPESSKVDKKEKKRKIQEAEAGTFVKRPKQSNDEENGHPEEDGDAEDQ